MEPEASFEELLAGLRPALRRALFARYGAGVVDDIEAAALEGAWEHHDRLRAMDNPGGYLFRVAQSQARKLVRGDPVFPAVPERVEHLVEPGLPRAMARLSERQRVAVVMVHGLGWTQVEAAAFLDLSESTLRNHLRRGMEKLRVDLGVDRGG